MKSQWLITFRTVTYAQKGHRLLQSASIGSTLQRTPKTISDSGCGYCLRLRRGDVMPALMLLKQSKITYGKVFSVSDGDPREAQL